MRGAENLVPHGAPRSSDRRRSKTSIGSSLICLRALRTWWNAMRTDQISMSLQRLHLGPAKNRSVRLAAGLL